MRYSRNVGLGFKTPREVSNLSAGKIVYYDT